MSTRSMIGIEKEDGTVDAIYCHFDGYFDGVGKTLKEHYTERSKVEELISLGSISVLAPEIHPDPEKEHGFYPKKQQENVVLAYHRDRGEELSISNYSSVNSFELKAKDQCWAEYAYTYLKDGTWKCVKLPS
jgi:hypothetical protein